MMVTMIMMAMIMRMTMIIRRFLSDLQVDEESAPALMMAADLLLMERVLITSYQSP